MKSSLPVWIALIAWESLVFLLPSYAQPQALKFKHLRVQEGLLSNQIRDVVQDDRGFIWLASWYNGLNRYDGREIKTYQHHPQDSFSLVNNTLWDLLVDHTGSLWVATNYGLNRYDPIRDHFISIPLPLPPNSLPKNLSVLTLFEDRHHQLWIGTESGIFCRSLSTNKLTHYEPYPQKKGASEVGCIYEDSQGTLWAGTQEGLYRYIPETGQFVPFFPIDVLDHTHINSITEDTKGNLWISTLEKGILVLDSTRQVQAHHQMGNSELPSDNITVIQQDQNHHLWIGTSNGLVVAPHGKPPFHTYPFNPDQPNGLNDNNILSVFEDHAGGLWIGTNNGGVNYLHHQPMAFDVYSPYNLNHFHSPYVQDVIEDRQGYLWVATDGGGVFQFDRRRRQVLQLFTQDMPRESPLHDNAIRVLKEDPLGQIWAGSPTGVSRIDPISKQVTPFLPEPNDPHELRAGNVLDLYEDHLHRLWVSTNGGASCFDPHTEQFILYRARDSSRERQNWVKEFYQDAQHHLWVKTGENFGRIDLKTHSIVPYPYTFWDAFLDSEGRFWGLGEGLFRYEPTTDRFRQMYDQKVQKMLEAPGGILWLMTDRGLERLNGATNTTNCVLPRAQLPGDYVSAMQADASGNIWISTQRGLGQYVPETNTFYTFNQYDGLEVSNLSGGGLSLSTGELLFFGQGGFILFHPDSLQLNTHIPPVVLTDLRISYQSMPIQRSLRDTLGLSSPLDSSLLTKRHLILSHRQNDLSLSFAAMDYVAPEKNQYEYRLEGYDDRWVQVASPMQVIPIFLRVNISSG